MSSINIFKPLSSFLLPAFLINITSATSKNFPLRIFWECWESSPGLPSEKQALYLCAMQLPRPRLFTRTVEFVSLKADDQHVSAHPLNRCGISCICSAWKWGSIRRKHNVRWRHLSRMKNVSFLFNFFSSCKSNRSRLYPGPVLPP